MKKCCCHKQREELIGRNENLGDLSEKSEDLRKISESGRKGEEGERIRMGEMKVERNGKRKTGESEKY